MKSLSLAALAFSSLSAATARASIAAGQFGKTYLTSTTGVRMRLAPRQHRFEDYINLSAADYRWLRGQRVKNRPAGTKLARKAAHGRIGITQLR